MTIHELLQAAGLTANDEIPIWDVEATGEPTKKVTAQQLATAVVALANLVTGVKGGAEGSYRTGNVNLTPANIGAVAKSGDTMNGTLTINNDSYSNNGFVRFWNDGEGGNIVIASPNGKEFQIDASNNNRIRCFAYDDNTPPNYKSFEFNRITGVLSASGGFNGNAATATGVKDAGDSSRTITIRYKGAGADATGWVPMYDTNGNLVPVTTANLGKKLGAIGVLVSASIVITASMSFDLSAYSRIECDFSAASQFGHLVMTEKNQWYYVSYLSEGAASATNLNMYAIKAKYTDSGITVDYCGYKNLSTGAWNDRIGNSGYLLRNIYGYA